MPFKNQLWNTKQNNTNYYTLSVYVVWYFMIVLYIYRQILSNSIRQSREIMSATTDSQ